MANNNYMVMTVAHEDDFSLGLHLITSFMQNCSEVISYSTAVQRSAYVSFTDIVSDVICL